MRGLAPAILVHAALVVLVFLGAGSAARVIEAARPIDVRLIEDVVRKERPPAPLPSPRQIVRQPQKPQPVMTSNAPARNENAFVVPEQPPAAPASPAPAAPPAPAVEAFSDARFDADYLSNPKPPYPAASRRLGESGTVHLRVQVDADGHALKVELKKSCGFPRLDQSAQETVAGWRFVPARRGQAAVTSWVVVPIVFSLS